MTGTVMVDVKLCHQNPCINNIVEHFNKLSTVLTQCIKELNV